MVNLETNYAGLKLKNPLIVSSSGLADSVAKVEKIDEQGAGAVVLKSLFEEQIRHESGKLSETSDYPEAADYINYYTRNNSVEQYLTLIEESKKKVDIPVIASINCVSAKEWVSFAREIETAGADALELNVFFLPTDKDLSSADYEQIYHDLADKVCNLVSIPVIMKLGLQFTNLTGLVNQLHYRGVNAFVLFNRFYAPDIRIEEQKMGAAEVFSHPSENRNTLRWIGIISAEIRNIDLAASTGIHDGEAFIKQILAGASAVEICSVLYKKGLGEISKILNDARKWMQKKNYKSIEDFKGLMSYKKIKDPAVYERAQFMRYFSDRH